MIDIERDRLPSGVKEGDVLIIEHDSITVDQGETVRRKESIGKLMNGLWE